MSNPISPQHTEKIVGHILSIYHGDGEKMHLLFEDKLITMKQFLLTILPSLAELNWCLDKDEIARVWNFLYVLHTKVTQVASEFRMHHGTAVGKSEEVLLHPTFMADVIAKKEGRHVPDLRKDHFDLHAGIQGGPTHELRILSFKSFWFVGDEPFLKRLRVVRDARIITFFIAEKLLRNGQVRFSITCLPHAHLNPFDVHKQYTGFHGGMLCLTRFSCV